MISDFLTRLAIALPLVSGLAVALLLAVKRGWIPLPRLMMGGGLAGMVPRFGAGGSDPADLRVVAVQPITPAVRVAVLRWRGREHLLGVCGGNMVLLASEDGANMLCQPGEGDAPWNG